MNLQEDLQNKVVVVTGGAGLIGKGFIEAIVQAGGIGIIADINLQAANSAKESIYNTICANSPQALASECASRIDCILLDITSKTSLQEAIQSLHARYGKIDALVNNAYPRTPNWGKKNFFEVEYEDFCANMNLQMGGYLLASQQFATYFKAQGYGNIISMSSIQGVYAPKFDTYIGTQMDSPIEYSMIKAGICHMTKYMAKYLANTGIRANAIAPGGILDNQPESFLTRYRAHCTSKGMLNPQDLSGTLLFLLSDASLYINGQTLIVDDGWGL
ncbi:oxidoreductase [Helicobacter marmotae]|uniref:KR domain-containing protein n=1 Tax=Helicobacter marmotae TaxID=152490 RepID=A0A3D8I1W2_9HELI|nr:oxidoreductase [Helicobacter marmotae]RDU59119.1 KR domain-containing protein [Helicobacter marmotae]